jgi:hypothetical protein
MTPDESDEMRFERAAARARHQSLMIQREALSRPVDALNGCGLVFAMLTALFACALILYLWLA